MTLRISTHTGRPLGSDQPLGKIEHSTPISLCP